MGANQHFVPKGYLKGFTIPYQYSDKFIWVYKKKSGINPEKRSIKKVSSQENYYAQEDEHGNVEPDKLENAISQVENLALPIIQRINTCENIVILNGDEFGHLAYFIGLSLARVPSFRNPISEMLKKVVETTANNMLNRGEFSEPPPKLKEYFEAGGRLKAEIKPWASLEPMLQISDVLAQSIIKKKWTFFTPYKGQTFITSDNPVIFYQDNRFRGVPMGPAHPMATILYPMRRDLALMCSLDEREHEGIEAGALENEKHINIKCSSKNETLFFKERVILAARENVYADYFSHPLKKLVWSREGTEQTILTE
ncbi:MAG: hypothetical protein COV66_13575 [Nitrospinae bacterium CG11_big_fil_rev_8_21_14_0_20_45_15]|nr:MAG: hypothetical protein COV66_13575 [Nitrospinae bacterium CG11_big_fil_rev_8_21_14_0_20_45_15]